MTERGDEEKAVRRGKRVKSLVMMISLALKNCENCC